MIQNGCIASQGRTPVNSRSCNIVISSTSVFPCASRMPVKVAVSNIRSTGGHNLECKSWLPTGMSFSNMSAASSLFLSGGQNLLFRPIPMLLRVRKSYMAPRASKDTTSTGFRYPPMTQKPRWWWRSLACLPYLMPFHETWMFAKTAFNLHPFLEYFKYYTYPFLMALGTLPRWSIIVYFIIAYLGVVRRKEWPHFIRFHVATGMLLEITLQVTGMVSRWLPRSVYWGKAGMHFWATVAFAHLFTVMECIRCAILGMYADVPFISDAAYIQIPFH